MSIEINPLITTKYSEVFVPAKTLDYGMYRFDLTVTMNYSSNYSNTESMYIKITSTITANLVQYGTSVITTGYTKNLILNPGKYSIDPDAETFKLNVSVKKNLHNFLALHKISCIAIGMGLYVFVSTVRYV